MIMGLLLTNNARSTLSAAINETEQSIRVRVGHGDRFPTPRKAGDWFPVTLEDQSGNIEILRATARKGDVLTVVRGAEGTQARAFAAEDLVELRLTAAAVFQAQSGGEDPVADTVSVSISDANLG